MSIHSNSQMGRRVFITGGCGFIGRRLVSKLLPSTAVAVFDDLSAGLPMIDSHEGLSLYRGDIRNVEQVALALQEFRPDTVVHLAALHHIPSCEDDPRRAMDINVVGLQTVLDECTRVACKQVLLASSGAVYAFSDQPLHEDMQLSPMDVYAASKLSNEHQLKLWASRTESSAITARLFNAIGWGDPNGHLIPDILKRLKRSSAGATVHLQMGNLHTRRDFVDVDDLAGGLAALLRSPCWQSGVMRSYNLCSGREISIPDIVHGIAECLGLCVKIESDPALQRRVDRPSQWGDPQKTYLEVGWRANIPITQSLHHIVQMWREESKTDI